MSRAFVVCLLVAAVALSGAPACRRITALPPVEAMSATGRAVCSYTVAALVVLSVLGISLARGPCPPRDGDASP